ncbi:MAG: histidine kinase [Firmicutes bacterium]|nr:histidine kinase [Bacillota bacterium]
MTEINDSNTREAIAPSNKRTSLATVAASVAHEVNNPLTFIKMNAQLLELMLERRCKNKDDCPVVDHKRSIDAIIRGTERIADIVSSLMFLARHELREKTSVSLSEALDEAWVLVKTNHELSEVQLKRTVGPDIMIYGNRQQIEQVLINLLDNAIKAIYKAGQSEGNISITASTEHSETEWVILKVTDNGYGIEQSVMSRIFEPFYTSDNEKGTGMGLAVVKGIVEEHGGTITVESMLGQGTDFTIRLPAYKSTRR